jgi:hypothetical protein
VNPISALTPTEATATQGMASRSASLFLSLLTENGATFTTHGRYNSLVNLLHEIKAKKLYLAALSDDGSIKQNFFF